MILQKSSITLGELVEHLEYRVYALGILIFALPSIIPLSVIPGIATFFGIPIFLLSLQLIFSKNRPWLPQWLKRKKIKTSFLKKLFHFTMPYLQKIEKYIQPRYAFFSTLPAKVFIGLLIAWLSLLLILPIPLSNMLFGGLIACLAIGLIEKDGLILFFGILMSCVTTIFYIHAVSLLFSWVMD